MGEHLQEVLQHTQTDAHVRRGGVVRNKFGTWEPRWWKPTWGCRLPLGVSGLPHLSWSLNRVSRSRPHAPRARALPPRCSPGCPAAPGPAPPHPSRRTPFGPRRSQRCPWQKAGRACKHASRFHSNQDDAAKLTMIFTRDTSQQHRVLLAAAVGARCIVGVVVWHSGAVKWLGAWFSVNGENGRRV